MTEELTDLSAELAAEKLKHMVALLRMEVERVDTNMKNRDEFMTHRLEQLEDARKDHETRIRALQDSATSFKVWSGLGSGAGFLTALAALLKSFLTQ